MNDFENNLNPQNEQDNADIPATEPTPVEPTYIDEPTPTAEPVFEDEDVTEINVEIDEPEQQPQPESQFEPSGYYPPPPPPPNFYNPGGFNPPPPPNPPQKNSNRGFKAFCVFLAIVVALTLGTGIGYILNDGENSTTKSVAEIESPDIEFVEDKVPTADDIKPDENGMYTETQVAQLVSPSVVTI